ncbi:MAG: NUDIX domain-containing protein [Patescibacteria group bacterium]|jgi:8-oxo-dGTP pyrophosphatase MutT (NUDIX family)
MTPKIFVAMKAFITFNGKVLILRESKKYEEGTNAARYDIVGGRIPPGERFDESLRREIREETGLEVTLGQPFHVDEWRPVVKGEPWQVVATFFVCETSTDAVTLSQDHDDAQWIDPKDFQKYNLIPNLIPAFEAFLKRNK